MALMSMFFFYFKQYKTAEGPRKTAPVKEAAEQTNQRSQNRSLIKQKVQGKLMQFKVKFVI